MEEKNDSERDYIICLLCKVGQSSILYPIALQHTNPDLVSSLWHYKLHKSDSMGQMRLCRRCSMVYSTSGGEPRSNAQTCAKTGTFLIICVGIFANEDIKAMRGHLTFQPRLDQVN